MIKINSNPVEFHLYTNNTSYIMRVLPTGHLVNLHYGGKVAHRDDFGPLYRNFSLQPGSSTNYQQTGEDLTLETTRLEVGTNGKGDYREPSIHLCYDDHSRVSDFVYDSHKISEGKPRLEGLPHTFGEEGVMTLTITLKEKVRDVYLHLSYSVFEASDVIARSIRIENRSKGNIRLDKAMSMNLDFMDSAYELISLEGKWIRESQIQSHKLTKGIYAIDSKKGVSGANHNPFLCLKRESTIEMNGDCYGFGLVYSGNHLGSVEVSPHNLTRVQMGINPFDFSWQLGHEESFQTPEVVMTYSPEGLNGMSHQFHYLVNHHLVSPEWQFRERPVLINNWEATYFDFDERKLMKLAKEAKNMGVELFVLDDGWFGHRDDDRTSLGDFFEHEKKLPNGLAGLSEKIRGLGLDFGIWVEPEMISEDSELFKAHPDWAVKLPNREVSLGRYQMMLDLCNPQVVDYLHRELRDVFIRGKVAYVKWDMNRNISDTWSNHLPKEQQEEFHHRYMLGLYDLLGRLKDEFKDILFESCSSGGNRFDLGMLYYMPQTWTSDNTDAGERVNIQYGRSLMYPVSTMGAHVSGEPSHQVLRNTPIESRFNVAAFGVLGYELDVTKISEFDKKVMQKQIEFYKAHRKLLQFGRFTRLQSPYEHNQSMWSVTSEDGNQALLGYYQKHQESNPGFEAFRMVDLNDHATYKVRNRDQFENIRRFGHLINAQIPVDLKVNGVVHNLVSDRYLHQVETQEEIMGGDQLRHVGFQPYHQFVGTSLTSETRFIGDYGSRLYVIDEIEE